MIKAILSTAVSLLLSTSCLANALFEHFPNDINAHEKYVFYSHGFIVEGDNPTPINPRWGRYEFPKIKKALSDNSYNLIAYHRPKDTKPRPFAKMLAEHATTLISQGVKPENITFIGFSRGGAITVLTSSYLANDKINFVILAGCSTLVKSNPELEVFGRVFSVFETSDDVGSCQFLIARSQQVKTFEELAISTGKEHGAFYRPMSEWVIPVKSWIKNSATSK